MDIGNEMLASYLSSLIGRVYKILPLWEENAETISVYIHSLQLELLGLTNLSKPLESEALVLSIISTLQYFIDHPDADVAVVRREVFRSIKTCDMLCRRYGEVSEK